MKQSVKKVAFLLADGYEDSEMKNPYDALIENGNDVDIISTRKGAELKGKKGTITYTSHLTASEANPDDYEAVVIPGGKSPEALREDPAVIDFVVKANQKGLPISAICHGPQVLAKAGLLQGKTLTSYPGIRDEVEAAGGKFVDREVVVDGNLITSRGPQDEPAFIRETIDKLGVSAY
ncbi:type 1 glutamine amidotransferase domain-containing protein [Cohnella sp. REN36]|uniref:type 1 glutamine amidotransferase domain-containing protein n=1 Tax=Cohnella sp. REN36 TaxID=2887347 RepID=UPI001D14E4B2|nr:type 1 glutamine amidotransferase domain-containing protein [Cohnella sp. REN36]MCC3374718.1 type 1 glutamine amidotransferase [Cohnella sp. REN36]